MDANDLADERWRRGGDHDGRHGGKLMFSQCSCESRRHWRSLPPPPINGAPTSKERQHIVESKAHGVSLEELGQELGLPVAIVASALDDYYAVALATILHADRPPEDDLAPDPNLDR